MGILPTQRALFNIPAEVAYFNCAANTPLLLESAQQLHAGVDTKIHPWNRAPDDFFEDAERIRVLAATLFGSTAHNFAVIPSASYGLSTAARVLEPTLSSKDEILIIAAEFPSLVLAFQRVTEETGAKIVIAQKTAQEDWTTAILTQINSATRVVAISSCHWTNGAYIDLLSIREACDQVGAALVVDATQTLGAQPLSLDQLKPDFMVAAGYKWLLCPYGFGLLYVAEQWQEGRPLEETWIARDNAKDFQNLVHYSDQYMAGARRFEVGEKCVPTLLPGAIAALEQLSRWGISNIAETLGAINQDIAAHLIELGFDVLEEDQRCPHILGAIAPAHCIQPLIPALKQQQIFISQRGNSLRFAPHLHINATDIERLKQAITKLL